ncbi:MAG: amino acid-binding protein, partial [bacterium]
MAVRQISVFLENKIGRLAEITQILGNKEINIR